MKLNTKWLKALFIIGVVLLFIGTIDPMEGSVLIAAGSILTAIAAHYKLDRHRKIFKLSALLIFVGVALLWYVSSLGGYEPMTEWWWNIGILPYPLGWLIFMIVLIYRAFKKPVQSEVKV